MADPLFHALGMGIAASGTWKIFRAFQAAHAYVCNFLLGRRRTMHLYIVTWKWTVHLFPFAKENALLGQMPAVE